MAPVARRAGFTLIELLMVIAIVGLLLALMVPALCAARTSAKQVQSGANVRSVHAAMAVFAQGNNGFYPGLPGRKGPVLEHTQIPNSNLGSGGSPRGRFVILLNNQFLPPNVCISPLEHKQLWAPGTPISTDHFSYGMLSISTASLNGRRLDEWQQTGNQLSIVVADRNTNGGGVFGDAGAPMSVHTRTPGNWRGHVAWNDNHVTFESSHLFETRYGDAQNVGDNLFDPAAPAGGANPAPDGNAAIQYN